MSSPRPVNRSRPRRDPLSCQMCRVKKLKCDRQQPCSNCRTRRLSCKYSRELPTTTVPTVENGDDDLRTQNAALRDRVLRLEQAVFGGGSSVVSDRQSSTKSSPMLQQRSESAANGGPWTNEMVRCPTSVAPHSSDTLKLTLRTPDQLALDANYSPKPNSISLPTRVLATTCVDLFETHLDPVQAITHIPSVREMIDNVYANINAEVSNPGAIALILAICACMGSWELRWDFLFTDPTASFKVSNLMAKQALHALENAHMLSRISIEAVQATMLLTFHFCHFEGPSPHTRLLHANAFTMARELGLHRIDAPRPKFRADTQAEIIEAEVGRKVWWHLASTDWLFAYTGGPHEGTYSIQIHQMAVNLPRNLNHDDLSIQDAAFTRPENETTTVTFHLQRIKIASICREVMDEFWTSSAIDTDPEQLSHERVLALDAKFCDLINSLPRPLQLDTTTASLKSELRDADIWNVVVQRGTINLMIYARRCKLHLPFLMRFNSDRRYGRSRQICLESARKVFEVRRRVHAEEISEGFTMFLTLGGQLSHIFYAAFVLVMDLCVNKASGDRRQVAEAHEAIKVMEEAKASSRVASMYLHSLMEVLRKHQVNLQPSEIQNTDQSDNSLQWSLLYSRGKTGNELESTAANVDVSIDDQMMNNSEMFEDVWQDYLFNGSSLDPQSWEALVNDLDMHIV